MRKFITGTFFLLFVVILTFAQSRPVARDLLSLKVASDSTNKKYAPEKLYMQTDKPYYATGDTIWFKAWLINAPTFLLSAKSGLLHIDIANDSNKVIKQYLLPVTSGVSWGNIALDEKEYKPGTYVIRAYTNWMRNFGEDYFYYKQIQVTGANENGWLVNTKVNTSNTSDKINVNAKLQFSEIDQTAVAGKAIPLQVMAGRKTLYKQTLQSNANGQLDINFTLPPKANNIFIIAENEAKDRKAIIPIILNHEENTDLQFLPEGGNLVAGLDAHICFKAISEEGKGVNTSGIITDHNNQPVASFQSLHHGMGSFDIMIKPNEIYTAKVNLPNGTTKTYPLPMVKASGTVLQVKNQPEKDSVEVSFSATEDIVQAHGSYFLIGKARGVICYAAIVSFSKDNTVTRPIAKSLFPTGITHFILMTPKGQPLNERLVYVDHHDELQIHIEPDQDAYAPKDSVALHIRVSDNTGNPVAGNFSLAVTDDTQVKTDSLQNENIISRMLLTSDLKGYIEEPGYYFQRQSKETEQALDNLLLTQGWVAYEPTQPKPQYEAETEYRVKGTVNNVFSKPVKGTKVILFSKSPYLLMDTLTDKEGRFTFHHFPRVDTPIFVLKAVNKNGKSFNVGIHIDETPSLVFSQPKAPITLPWYVNSDSTLMNYVKDNIANKKLQEYKPDSKHQLKEVVIKATKIIKGSQNLNGSGNADQVFDEKDMEQAGKKTFLDLFEEKIKGFREAYFFTPENRMPRPVYLEIFAFESSIRHAPASEWYYIKDKPVILIVDGTDVEDVIPGFNFLAFMTYLRSHSAEDIKGIEVNASSKYNGAYLRRGKWLSAPLGLPFYHDFAFIEVTTRSGHGPVIDNTPGMYLHKPLAISWPAQFYKPLYKITDTVKRSLDIRSTIDWEPNISTDADGKATISFYAADRTSTYTITMDGIDFNGNLGFKRQKININKQKFKTK
jgi:hypothetical protein